MGQVLVQRSSPASSSSGSRRSGTVLERCRTQGCGKALVTRTGRYVHVNGAYSVGTLDEDRTVHRVYCSRCGKAQEIRRPEGWLKEQQDA